MATPKVVTDELRVLPLLDHLARVGRRAAEAAMAPSELRPRHLVALTLLAEHGPVGQQTLAETLHLDPSNVVGLLNELEDRDFVVRRRDPADRRRHIVELSPTGVRELRRLQRRLRTVEESLLAGLTVEERATLHGLLTRAAGTPSCAEAAVAELCTEAALDSPGTGSACTE
ncbi:MarR family winged helix-turn-helix transcriptional regulator [Sporichthya brevicatena]|uniref:MarR family winged helix-turn-helix transcriptional regulator n=1 Tax=Sporichthya brevicatena TaxID=171442 RepID=A0ABN1GPU5_9ACTN